MRRVIASEFVSLDGVMESPDQWHFPYFNDEMGEAIGTAMAQADAMLMGRVLYEEWAAYWPHQDPEENPVAVRMNGYPPTCGLHDPPGAARMEQLDDHKEQRRRRGREAQAARGQGHPRLRAAPTS